MFLLVLVAVKLLHGEIGIKAGKRTDVLLGSVFL